MLAQPHDVTQKLHSSTHGTCTHSEARVTSHAVHSRLFSSMCCYARRLFPLLVRCAPPSVTGTSPAVRTYPFLCRLGWRWTWSRCVTEALLREGTVELDGSFVFVLLFSSVYVSYSPLLGGLATQTAILVCNLVCHLFWTQQGPDDFNGYGLFLRSFVLYRPWIPGEHRRGTSAVECVAAHLRGFEEDSRSEVVFWIEELSIEFHRRGTCAVECVVAHLRGSQEDSRSEVVLIYCGI